MWNARRASLVLAAALVATPAPAQEAQPPQPRRPQAQRPAREALRPPATGTAAISGRVLADDTGRPVKRARVVATGAGRPHAATTDELGRYQLTALPAGSYRLTATKTGFVDVAFGQRRALGTGTAVEIAEGQQVANVDMRLPRGGVITGRVADEDGEPLARALVSVLRYQYVRGQRQLLPAGTDQTDDRGQYRVFGLPPGDYFVSAASGVGERIAARVAEIVAGAGGRGGRGGAALPPDAAADSSGYAPTYFPGSLSLTDAGRVKLGTGQELAGIDFQLQLVALATVRGTVVDAAGTVMLIPDEGPVALRAQSLRAPVQQDGSFTIRNVPPGRYTAMARADGILAGEARTAMQSVLVAGSDLTITLVPVKGASVAGTITFETAGSPTPTSLSAFRVNAVPLDPAIALPRLQRPAIVNQNASFQLVDLVPGRYVIQASAMRGWTMKSATLNGRDVSEEPVEIKGGEQIDGLSVIFSDRTSGISGTVADGGKPAAAGLTVIAFPAEDGLRRPQSRRIRAARTTEGGAYTIGDLPPGDYLVVVVDDVEQGEWFDPEFLASIASGAVRTSVEEGAQRQLTLKPPRAP